MHWLGIVSSLPVRKRLEGHERSPRKSNKKGSLSKMKGSLKIADTLLVLL
jgi:hypothetical protein